MNRLTKKLTTNSNYEIQLLQRGLTYVTNTPYNEQLIHKLGKLEDLEDEFKCPLEIVLKIMLGKIDTIIVNYGDGGYGSPYTEYITANTSNIYYDIIKGLVIETNICDIPIKDYKVNWWLKEDLSE